MKNCYINKFLRSSVEWTNFVTVNRRYYLMLIVLLFNLFLININLKGAFTVWKGSQEPTSAGFFKINTGNPSSNYFTTNYPSSGQGQFYLDRDYAFSSANALWYEYAAIPIGERTTSLAPTNWTVSVKLKINSIVSPPNTQLLAICVPVSKDTYGSIYFGITNDSNATLNVIHKTGTASLNLSGYNWNTIRFLGKWNAYQGKMFVEIIANDNNTVLANIEPVETPRYPAIRFGDLSASTLYYPLFQGDTDIYYEHIAWDTTGAYNFSTALPSNPPDITNPWVDSYNKVSTGSGGVGRKQILNVDFYDLVIEHGHALSESDIYYVCREAKLNGVDVINLRVMGMKVPDGSGGNITENYLEKFDEVDAANYGLSSSDITARQGYANLVATTFANVNVLEKFTLFAHGQGLKIWAWIDIFDGWFPGIYDPYLNPHPDYPSVTAHPEYQWRAKATNANPLYFKGVMSYGNSACVNYRIQQINYFLGDIGMDGVYLSQSCHSRHYQTGIKKQDYYGYEPCVRDRMRNIYGTAAENDIWDASFPIHQLYLERWNGIKGDIMFDFYDAIKTEVETHSNTTLAIGLQLGATINFCSPYESSNVVARYTNWYEKIIDQNVADYIIANDYESADKNDAKAPYWWAKNSSSLLGNRWNYIKTNLVDYSDQDGKRDVKILLHVNYLPGTRDSIDYSLDRWCNYLDQAKDSDQSQNIDQAYGLIIHEAITFRPQWYPNTWFDLLLRSKMRLDDIDPGPLQ
jgi:hypothetical protein